jgi:hypothetical protein
LDKKKELKKIWVPPKPKPSLPFGMGPAPEPVEPKDYEETNYSEYEKKLLKEAVQSVLMSAGISIFMSFQFQIHMSLLMQAIMMPLTAYDNPILKKYILGVTKAADGGPLYKELFSAPTKESIAIAEKLTAARAAGVGAANAGVIATDEPRVEELPEDAPVEEKSEKEAEKATPATEID